MIAAMRPSHAHPTASSTHSRPSSRTSSHNTTSALASPSVQSKNEKLAAKAALNVANGISGKKASATKKAAKSQQNTDVSKPSSISSPVPGLITLTKPMSEDLQASKQQSCPSKSKKAKEAKFASDEAISKPVRTSRSRRSKSSPRADASEMLLSKSAPSAPLNYAQQPELEHGNANGVEQASALTWQQEMFQHASNSRVDLSHQGNGSKRNNKKATQHSSATKHDGNLAHPQKVQDGRDSPALTWQQELLGAKKRSGPHFDVFADARDVETFGTDDGSAQGHAHANGKTSKRRPRTGSFGSGGQKNGTSASKGRGNNVPLHIDDLFESAKADGMAKSKSAQLQRNADAPGDATCIQTEFPAHGAPIHIAPSTPVKKVQNANANQNQQHPAVAAAIAYAGPNFHNSPSPASLPAPKFQNRLGKSSSELDRGMVRSSSLAAGSSGESGGSDDEVEVLTRGVRGITAPAEMTSTPTRAPVPATAPSHYTAAAESPAAKPSMQPGATVESLLARMLGGARLG